MTSKKIIAGNWKQNGNLRSSLSLSKNIINGLKKAKCLHEIIIFPPSTYLLPVRESIKKVKLKIGAQNVSAYPDGALTGEISASMLSDLKLQYCLVGHSERRHIIKENEQALSNKVSRLYENNIKVIYCIGETLSQYKKKQTKLVIRQQIKQLFRNNEKNILNKPQNLILAYEPVWAIGTGLLPSSTELNSTFSYIRSILDKTNQRNSSIKILYGGSVSPENSSLLLETKYMDGLLIGGASLIAKKFIDICSTI